jgi:host factor-I protein|tara:strand:- start:425 stop:676 length:252 start_codon:yes stop_codon:yes gene_type:complete
MLKKAIETPEKNSLSDIETDFVNHAIEKSKELTIFLVNGIKLEGTIIAMGSNSFLLKRDDNIQLVYKHSISTILPLDSSNFID